MTAPPELPPPSLCLGGGDFYHADTVRQLLADERERVLSEAEHACRSVGMSLPSNESQRGAYECLKAVRALARKEPTT